MSIQKADFPDGGFVLHKIPAGSGRMSAWYDKDGRLLDAEYLTDSRRGSRPVKRGGPLWAEAETYGRRYAAKPNPRGVPRAGARLPSGTSQIWGRPIKTWKRDGFTLRLYDTNVPTGTGRLGETFLAYDFFDGQKLIFTGDRYRVAPGYAVDSMASVYGLLGFLSLKPGDTDDEYFKDYSPAQMAWVESGRAEDLGLLVALNEERAGRREYRRRIR